ncbi:MAG: hypothetical protein RIB45_09825 [Marivibrio sp.]|uniref:hypothetical protein n=1 Tax=Marivibrio sp. TaxID=2039719 RepID=UPI0032F09C0D
MTHSLSNHFLRASVLYALAGMALGIHMAASRDHGQHATHAHLMLFGWIGMTLYALVYRLLPATAEGILPKLHASLAHLGLIGLTAGLYLLYADRIATGEPIAAVASLALFANMALFGLIVFRATGRAAAPA